MQLLGQRATSLLALAASSWLAWAVLGAVVALVPALCMWGFTVDDALISVRYARHLAAGDGWRFNAVGPSTDGVTPLSWPVVLWPLARGGALEVLARAQALGLAAWTATGAAIGVAVARADGAPRWARLSALLTLALSVPVAAYAVAGMETPVATALATLAAILVRRPRASAIVAGLAAAFRPELAVWAVVLAVGASAITRPRAPRASPPLSAALSAGAALGPFVLCALVRAAVWGRPAPLALLAKPSDLDHGLAYAGAACVVTLTPCLVLAPIALRRCAPAAVIALAGLAHVLAVVAVGGDWMPYARLLVPIAPGLAFAAALASARAHPAATGARALLALGIGLVLLARGGASGRRVGKDRAALVEEARPALAGATRVASLDVGWVGAATEAEVIDLAGVTDPEVAALPGGHTSKRVDGVFLLTRGADALLLFAPGGLPIGGLADWARADYPRRVEARLAGDAVVIARFQATAWLPLGRGGAGYVLLRRAPSSRGSGPEGGASGSDPVGAPPSR